MKFWASFILACIALLTAFLAIFDGSIAAVFNFGTKYIEVAGQLNNQAQASQAYGLSVQQPGYQSVPTQPVPYPGYDSRQRQPVQFQIANGLSDGQLSEVTTVYMGEPHQMVGQFQLSARQPTGNLVMTARDGPGEYRYSLATDVVIAAQAGSRRLQCRGEGVVRVMPDSTFSVQLLSHNPVTDECIVGLQ